MDVSAIISTGNSVALVDQKTKVATALGSAAGSRSADSATVPDLPGSGDTDDADKTERLRKAVENANQWQEALNSHLEFSIDEATRKVVVKVIDGSTNEVVRQIPADEMLELAAKFREINALLFSQKV